jgi:hypothetical protein
MLSVYLLLPLKSTLRRLSVALNPGIDDDAVPALLLLRKLSLLSIMDTGITIEGLRRFAKAIENEQRVVDIEIPESAEAYVDRESATTRLYQIIATGLMFGAGMQTMYLIDIKPPLITKPVLCAQLSRAALKRNLEAHHAVNKDILANGTKAEMKERLETLLKRREVDLLVRGMIYGEDSVEGEVIDKPKGK